MFCTRFIRLLASLLCLTPFWSMAQSPCPTSVLQGTNAMKSGSLICLLPQVYGAGGLVGVDNRGPLLSTAQFSHAAHFQQSSISSFSPINSEIGIQLSQQPLAAPSSGFLFAFQGGVMTQMQTESFGPLLTDRAETIGRHKLYVGFSYQYFDFDNADGVNLRNFGAVFTHEPEPQLCNPPNPRIPCLDGEPIFTRDIIATQNRIDLKANQYTIVGTFGLTDKLDLSLALPILNVRMDTYSTATISNFEAQPPYNGQPNHRFVVPAADPTSQPYVSQFYGVFYNHNSATGIGDLVFRAKYKAWQGEKSAVAVGVDLRFPSGDAYNFLGSGAWGVRPFVTYSRSGRISPHGTLGFQINSDSILASNITQAVTTKGELPNIFTYSAGADFLVMHRLSLTGDFIGLSLFSTPRISQTTYTDFAGNSHSDLSSSRGTVTQADISVGGKYNPVGKLLISANVLFILNYQGLHSKPVPLIGISYLF